MFFLLFIFIIINLNNIIEKIPTIGTSTSLIAALSAKWPLALPASPAQFGDPASIEEFLAFLALRLRSLDAAGGMRGAKSGI